MFGSLPEWVAAFAALGALYAAVSAVRQAKRLFGVETGRDAQSQESAKRAQARSISSWVAAEIDVDDRELSYGVVISNASREVIYGVRVMSTGKAGETQKDITLTILPPGDYYVEELKGKWTWDFAKEVSGFNSEIRPVTKSPRRRILELAFRDSNDARWVRLESGCLSPVTGESASV